MARNPSLRLAVAACTLTWIILTWIIVPAAAADEASRWDGDARSAIRLIAGTRAAGDAVIPAGIEIKLKPGWHTYWRYPGDAGIPPHFDFQGSQNVKSVEVRWPAPKRLPEGSVMTIGYDRDVTLPIAVVPEDPAKPVTLRMKADYAICEKVCAPADGKAELTLVPGASKLQAQLTAAGRLVPKPQTVGQGTGLAIRSVSQDSGRPAQSLEAPHGGRCGCAAGNRGGPVCRGSYPRMGIAGAEPRRRRPPGTTAVRIRSRRRAAAAPNSAVPGSRSRRLPGMTPSRCRSVSTNPAGTLTCGRVPAPSERG